MHNSISESLHVPSYTKRVSFVMQVIIFLAGLYQIFLGDWVMGVIIMVILGAIVFPGLFTRNYISYIPIEFQLIFFTMTILQYIVGETLRFYYIVPYYDKLVHFFNPMFIGFVSFLIAYSLYRKGNLKMTLGPLVVLIVLIAMGVGAIWEITEYMSDRFLLGKFEKVVQMQGSFTEPPLEDTMHDLMFDLAGGFFGAVLGMRYIDTARKYYKNRLAELVQEIAFNFRKKDTSA